MPQSNTGMYFSFQLDLRNLKLTKSNASSWDLLAVVATGTARAKT